MRRCRARRPAIGRTWPASSAAAAPAAIPGAAAVDDDRELQAPLRPRPDRVIKEPAMSVDGPESWRAKVPFTSERIGAVAVYCSDGRFGEAFDEFLHERLQLPRYDRLAVPGGAACLGGHFVTWREQEAITNQIRFLVEVHRITRVVLNAHKPCAFYSARLKLHELDLDQRQRDDLVRAAEVATRLGSRLQVDAFLAQVDGRRVRFDPVTV